MRTLLIATMMLALTGCESAAEFATEKALEAASGGKVDIDGKTITIIDENGKKVTTTIGEGEDGKVSAVVTDEDGKVSKMTAEGEQVRIETADGGTAVYGNAEVPEGFPLPVIDGAKIAAATKADQKKKGTVYNLILQVEGQDAGKVAAFYEQALEDVDVKARKREVKMGPKTMIQIAGKKGKKIRAQVTVTGGGAEPTSVIINWTEK